MTEAEFRRSAAAGMPLDNPMNVVRGAAWRGLHPVQTHEKFCRFVEPIYGLRAGAVILRNYRLKHGIATLGGVTARYAPQADQNDPAAYARTLAQLTGWHPDQEIDLRAFDTLLRLLPAMVRVESGSDPFARCQYEDAVRLA